MNRFLCYAPGSAGQDRRAWETSGFKMADDIQNGPGVKEPDVIFFDQTQGLFAPDWQQVVKHLPKLWVVVSRKEINFPECLSGIYETQVIVNEGYRFGIGSRLQGEVAEPNWEARDDGLPAGIHQLKAVAESINQFLLDDAFRETAEWCGHMSSVVGPA